MSTTVAQPVDRATPDLPAGAGARRPSARPAPVVALALVLIAALAAVHLSQGTADVRAGDLLAWLLGRGSETTAQVLVASRLPRLLAGLAVGFALGAAGLLLQALTRNPLAAPDTLAVNAGAHLSLTAVAALGLPLGVLSGTLAAFVGGLAAALAVLALARHDATPERLVLIGSVTALALASLTSALMIMFSQETSGLFAWGSGSLNQAGLDGVAQVAAPIALAVLAVIIVGRRLDVLQLGEDAARSLGVPVRSTRLIAIAASVLLAAAAVSLAGPIGFVGLCAPAAVRLLAPLSRALRGTRAQLFASGLAGAVLVIAADVALRAVLGARDAIEVPSGVVTTLVGAVVLVVVAHRMRASSAPHPAGEAAQPGWTRRHPHTVLTLAAILAAVLGVLALLAGDGWLLLGDLANWVQGVASGRISFMFEARLPRVTAAVLAGACLALAGSLTQSATRNPLADPGILGVSAGAGAGALSMLVLAPGTGYAGIALGALAGAFAAGALVFALAARGGFEPTRLVLTGVGVSAAASALTAVLVVQSDPWNQSKAITWLGGSTYGAALPRLGWVATVLIVGALASAVLVPRLDLLQLDADTPRLLGVRTEHARAVALITAVALTAAATAGIGVIGFVGLVAPHAARRLVGARHRVQVPLAVALGVVLTLLADTVGRSALAPTQLPVGLVCALVGTPYFLMLMRRGATT